MARIRKWVCYRDYKRAYTRYSKYKKLCYVRARPANRISRYTGGKQDTTYPVKLHLMSKAPFVQIRDHALESARQVSIRRLDVIGKTGYFFQMRVYPHHIVRENPLASGAGADRLSTGMAHNYGKPIGLAAQIKKGQPIFTVHTTKDRVNVAREALKKSSYKLPCPCTVVVEDMSKKVAALIAKDAAKKAIAKAA